MNEHWFDTDDQKDVLHSLRHAQSCKHEAAKRPEMWKWSIIAMHSALQGAMVCHLSGTQQIGALKADQGRRRLDFNQHDRDPRLPEPKAELASIHALFQRTTTGTETNRNGNTADWVKDISQAPIEVSDATRRAFEALVSFRNEFVHFQPRGWSIELSGMSEICAHISALISKIKKAGWAFRFLSQEDSQEMDQLLQELAS